ncbi:MAG TPA: glycosyltransferase [Bacteroidota bacterium]|nr:glycosyltransferase [Bacteroidota bacterium]
MAAKTSSRGSSVQLSVIIVNYNVREFLHHALVSLKKAMRGIRAEVLVVDNASDDGSVQMLQKDFPWVRLIINKSNEGFARANNRALRRARGKYLLLINPDTVVQEDTLKVMLRFFEENPDVGLAGCKILNPDGTFQLACRRSFPTPWVAFTRLTGLSKLFPKTRLLGRYNLTYLSPDETYEIDAVSGSFMMTRRKVYNEVGGLDERFFMYGEDLDWCYRIQKAGWKIYYVHSTQIIHYKGESTRRSSIDEIKMFYEAMQLFVRKHLTRSVLLASLLKLAIAFSSRLAMIRAHLRPVLIGIVDIVLVDLALMVAEFIWLGEIFHFPSYAYPIVYVVPAVIVVASLYVTGVYTHRRMSVSRTIAAVVVAYVIIAAIVFFFRSYAFSRAVLAISGMLSVMLLPGWRLIAKVWRRDLSTGRKSLLGRRTLIVGADRAARELLRRLRQRVADGYEVVGFIDSSRRTVGQKIDGLAVLGSLDNIGKVIQEHRVSDVIFSTQKVSYADILGVIGRTRELAVNFHLVPTKLEVMIGKASVDSLDELPLVQITYNIEKPLNRIAKRMFDLGLGGLLLISIYPFVYFTKSSRTGSTASVLCQLPDVVAGRMSLVGPPPGSTTVHLNGQPQQPLFIGKPGLTGLIQLQRDRQLTAEEIEQYNLYYAKNQSLALDVEILLKTLIQRERRTNAESYS